MTGRVIEEALRERPGRIDVGGRRARDRDSEDSATAATS